MKMTENIQRAIGRFLSKENKTGSWLADRIGISEGALSRWRSGKVRHIKDENFEKLYQYIRPYLNDSNGSLYDVRAMKQVEVVKLPLIGFAQAANYEASLQDVEEFAREAADGETAAFVGARDGDIALTIEGTSMLPWYPPGTVLMVRPGEFPQRGDVVVARLSTGEVVCKIYNRKDGVISLLSLNEAEGKSYKWHVKKRPGFIQWMWPVIASQRDERAIRWQAKRMGIIP